MSDERERGRPREREGGPGARASAGERAAPAELSMEQRVQVAEALQSQLNILEAQFTDLQGYLADVARAKNAIAELAKGTGGGDVLVPLGAGAHVRAKVQRVETVIAPLGAGVMAEEPTEAAVKRLDAREVEARKALEQVAATMGRLEEQLTGIVETLREAQGAAPEE